MLRKIIFLALVASTAAYTDKPASSDILKKASTTSVETEETAGTILDLNTSESQKVLTTLKSNKEVLKKVAEDRVDTLDEKSDVVTNYEAGTPVSQGNLYYYYYPVAAYPVNAQATDKVSATSGTSDLLSSPLLFILVPLLLLLVAVPVIALL